MAKSKRGAGLMPMADASCLRFVAQLMLDGCQDRAEDVVNKMETEKAKFIGNILTSHPPNLIEIAARFVKSVE